MGAPLKVALLKIGGTHGVALRLTVSVHSELSCTSHLVELIEERRYSEIS